MKDLCIKRNMRLRVNKHLILYFAVFILLFHFICYLLLANLVVPKALVEKDLDKQESSTYGQLIFHERLTFFVFLMQESIFCNFSKI